MIALRVGRGVKAGCDEGSAENRKKQPHMSATLTAGPKKIPLSHAKRMELILFL